MTWSVPVLCARTVAQPRGKRIVDRLIGSLGGSAPQILAHHRDTGLEHVARLPQFRSRILNRLIGRSGHQGHREDCSAYRENFRRRPIAAARTQAVNSAAMSPRSHVTR